MISKILGALMVAAPIFAAGYFMVKIEGWKVAVAIWAVTIVAFFSFVVGTYLITK